MKRAITIIDLANETGVSKSTISRVINGRENVSPEARARVLEAIARHDYQLNAAARALRTERSRLVGLVVPGMRHVFYSTIAEVLERELRREGISLLIACSGGLADGELLAIGALRSHAADAFVLSLVDEDDKRIVDALRSINQPTVLLDREVKGVAADAVLTDPRPGMREALEHLTSLGHRYIALVSHAPAVRPGRQVKTAFEQLLSDLGLTPAAEVLIPFDRVDAETGRRAAADALDAGATALLGLCPSPVVAGILQCLLDRQLQVPDDISVIVYDETDLSAVMRPALSAVVRPIEEGARLAAELVVSRLGRPRARRRTEVIETGFILRGSTGPIPDSERPVRNDSRLRSRASL